MPDAVAAPAVPASAPAPAAPAVSSSAPTPEAPASSAPAAASAPDVSSLAAPASPSAPAVAAADLNPDDFPSWEEYADAVFKANTAAKEAKAAEVPGDKPAEPTVPVSDATPAPDAQPPDKIVPDGDKPADTPAPEPELKLEDLEKAPDGLDIEPPATVKFLYDKLKENPDLAKNLKAAGLDGAIFKNARLVGELSKDVDEYQKVAATPEIAADNASKALNFMTLDNAFVAATTPEGANNFLKMWQQMAQFDDGKGGFIPQTDPRTGAVIVDRTGNPIPALHPAYSTLMANIFENQLKFFEGKFPEDTDVLAALSVLRERLAPPSPAIEELPEEARKVITDRQAELDRRENEQNRRLQTAAQAEAQRLNNVVADDATKALAPMIEQALSKINFPTDKYRESAQNSIEQEITEAVTSNPQFRARMEQLNALPQNAAVAKQKVNLMIQYTNAAARPILVKAIKDFSQPAVQQQAAVIKAKEEKVTQQTAASRSEVVSSRGPAAVPQQQTPEQMYDTIVSDYKKAHNGEEPSAEKITEIWMGRKTA